MKKCREAKKEMVLYCYGELNPEEKSRLEHHLADCPECRSYYESVKKTISLMSRAPRMTVDDFYWTRFNAKINASLGKKSGFKFYRAIPTAVVLAICIGLFVYFSRPSGKSRAELRVPSEEISEEISEETVDELNYELLIDFKDNIDRELLNGEA